MTWPDNITTKPAKNTLNGINTNISNLLEDFEYYPTPPLYIIWIAFATTATTGFIMYLVSIFGYLI